MKNIAVIIKHTIETVQPMYDTALSAVRSTSLIPYYAHVKGEYNHLIIHMHNYDNFDKNTSSPLATLTSTAKLVR